MKGYRLHCKLGCRARVRKQQQFFYRGEAERASRLRTAPFQVSVEHACELAFLFFGCVEGGSSSTSSGGGVHCPLGTTLCSALLFFSTIFSAVIRAFIPAPKAQDAQIQLPCASCIFHVLRVLDCTSRPILFLARLRRSCCASRVCPRPQGTRRADSAPPCSLQTQRFACFGLHFQVHSVLSSLAALVLRFARLSPPPRYETRRFSSPVLLAFFMFCVFWIALPGPFRAEPACGARAALRAFVPAPRAQNAQIRVTPKAQDAQIQVFRVPVLLH
jgi:hypothetical protein